jgi:hypothetical protein
MTELPDDELDKLFRKSSEEFDPTYEPADWDALNKRLDQEDGKSPLGWLKKWWPLGLLTLLIPMGLGYYWFNNSGSEATDFKHKEKVTEIGKTARENSDEMPADEQPFLKADEDLKERQSDGISKNLPSVSTTNEEISKTKDLTNDDSIVYTNRYRSGDKNTVKSRLNRSGKKSRISSNIKKTLSKLESQTTGEDIDKFTSAQRFENGIGANNVLSKSENFRQKSAGISDINLPTLNTGVDSKELASENAIEAQLSKPAISVNLISPQPFKQNEGLELPNVDLQENAAPSEQDKQRGISPKMAVRFGYSPDLTTVGLKNFSKPGAAVSLMVEYSIFRKLYFQTGVVRSVKDYTANASEYQLSKYVTDINTPYGVDGTCTMIEIPVGFRYDMVQNERSRIFAGAGFASYYVQKEKYDYKYADYVHGQAPGWKGKTGWFWLSHSTVSVGYEHRISNKLSLLAEPYIRIPLKGVGYGKVNLVTTGMWLSLRYTPVFNK